MRRVPKYPKSVGICTSEERGMAAELQDLGPKVELRYVVTVWEDKRVRLQSSSKYTHVALADFDRVCAGFKLGRPSWAPRPAG